MAIKQAEDKTWYVRASYKEKGKYRTKSKFNFKTKKEAVLWEQEILKDISSGDNNKTNPVFSQYFLDWFNVYKRPKVSAPTIVNYIATFNKLDTYFKELERDSITRTDYQRFLNHYGKNLSKGTMTKIHKHIRSCIQDALHNGEIDKDFTYKAEVTGKDGKSESSKFLNHAESKLLIKELNAGITPNMLTRHMALLALATGMRYSEIAGLTHDSLNFDECTLNINKSWNYKENTFKSTKTKVNRIIKLERSIMDDLRVLLLDQKKKQLSGKLINPDKLIFSTYNGTPPSNDAANKSLRKACKRSGIKDITFHSLRHTHVSILLYKGMDLSSIAKRVGHASTTTTADTYTHIIEEMQNKSDKLSDSVIKELFS